MSLKKIKKELAILGKEYTSFISQHNARLSKVREQYKNLYFTCRNCKEKSQLKNLILIKVEYYDSNAECSFDSSERQLLCLKCMNRNRFLSDKSKGELVTYEKAYREVLFHLPHNDSYTRSMYGKPHFINGKKFFLEELPFVNL